MCVISQRKHSNLLLHSFDLQFQTKYHGFKCVTITDIFNLGNWFQESLRSICNIAKNVQIGSIHVLSTWQQNCDLRRSLHTVNFQKYQLTYDYRCISKVKSHLLGCTILLNVRHLWLISKYCLNKNKKIAKIMVKYGSISRQLCTGRLFSTF